MSKFRKCYNCKFAGKSFKIAGKTHMHCEHPKQDEEFKSNPNFSAWDTLRVFWNTCQDHKLKINVKPNNSHIELIPTAETMQIKIYHQFR